MAATTGVLLSHLGSPNHDESNPASLTAHNTAIKRKPIISTSLPPFRTCRDLIFVSRYAQILHCLLRVSGTTSLEAFANGLTAEKLRLYAEAVLSTYINNQAIAKLCREPAKGKEGKQKGDMVWENACLFLQDALLLRLFCDAIKLGNSGRIVVILKLWALSFRAQGRMKYAQEVLFLVHNITHMWPKAVVYVLLHSRHS